MKQKCLLKKRLFEKIKSGGLLMLLLIGFTVGATAQVVTVSGTVTDETGVGLPGVNIIVEGTSTGTISDVTGDYEIKVNKGSTLSFTFTGYATQSIPVGNNARIDVSLKPNTSVLDEVVVTGYSSQRKRDITGAVSVVDAEELNQVAATSFTQKLEGRAAGVTISTSGEPGEGTNVRIRGISSFQNNDPLYIIDGVPVQDNYSTNFNPADIESIQVLKDASAASIYGARANNGVIIITTKKGEKGRVKISYDAWAGVATPINTPDYMITDPKDWSEVLYTRIENAGLTVDASNPYSVGRGQLPTYSFPADQSQTEADYSYPDNLVMRANQSGTDWFDEVFSPALQHEHNLGISGGTDFGSYYFSFGYLDQEGTMLNNYFQRFSVRANTSFTKGRFTFGENISFARSNGVGNDGVDGGNQDEQGVMTWVTLMNPLTPIYDVGGNFAGDKAAGLSNGTNPVAALERSKNNESTNYRLLGNVYGEVQLMEGLKARTSFGASYGFGQIGAFTFPRPESREPNLTNNFTEDWNYNFDWTWTNTLAYDLNLASAHSLQFLVGYEAIRNSNRYFNGQYSNYVTQDINAWYLNNGLADAGSRVVTTGGGYSTLASVFGKVDYAFQDKYLISGTIRRDGSSKFGPNNRYGVFPAVSLGWRVSNEAFLENAEWLEDLKLRFGWGITGNQAIPDGNAFDRYGGSPASTSYDIDGNNTSVTPGYALRARGNKDAKWEENISTNFGVDASFWDGKLGLVVDVYKRTVDGLLFNPFNPGTAGTADPAYLNVAKMENNGIDVGLDYRNRVSSDLSFNIGINVSHYKNEVVDIDGSSESFIPGGFDSRIGDINFNKVGLPISSFYGWTTDGLFRTQAEVDAHAAQDGKAVGKFRYKDLNNDGIINDDDKGHIGDPHPDFYGGLNIGVNYKNFDFTIFLFGSYGNEIFNYQKLFDTFGFFNSNVRKDVIDRAFDPVTNPNGTLPRLNENDIESEKPNDFYVEDASYLRCKNMQLGYTFPFSGSNSLFSNLRVYVQAQNLFTITGYSGLDPAPSNFGVQDSNPNDPNAALKADMWNGFDFGNYPANKIFMIGVNAGF